MDQEKQILFAVDGVNGSVGASSVALRAPCEAPTEPAGRLPDPEVVALAKRRRFTAGYKRRILRAAAACKASGEVGSLLRREGLYSSHLTHWRREIEAHDEAALRAKEQKNRGGRDYFHRLSVPVRGETRRKGNRRAVRNIAGRVIGCTVMFSERFGKPIVITDHARERMAARAVSEALLHDMIERARYGTRTRHGSGLPSTMGTAPTICFVWRPC